MTTSSRFSWLIAACLVIGAISSPARAFAQADAPANPAPRSTTPVEKPVPEGPQLPILVVNIASIDRVLTDVDYMFQAAERPDMMELVTGFITNTIGDLKGMNREKPFGVMLFLAPGLPPTPTPVVYVPVDGIDDLLKIIEAGPIKPRKVDGKEGHYELSGRRRRENFYCVMKNGYAYLTNVDNKHMLDAELPEPAAIAEPMAAKHDLGVSVLVKNIPITIRTVLLAFLRQSTEAQLQQRDNEPEAAYKMRRANGLSTVEFIEQMMTQCEQIQFGVDASKERKNLEVELLMDATPDSELAKHTQNLAGRKSYFSPLFNDSQPLTVSASWKMDKRERKAAAAMVEAMRIGLAKELPEGTAPGIDPLFDSLKATAEQGDMDFCVQFQPVSNNQFVFLGGLRVVGGESFGKGLAQLLTSVQGREELDKVELNADTHAGIVFHRLAVKNVPRQEQRTYGGTPSVYLGTSSQTLWFTVGADQAMPHLKTAIDEIQTANATTPGGGTAYPFQMILHTAPWLNRPDGDDRDVSRQEFAQKAFHKDSDALRISVQPTETGTRSRAVLDEGFIKLVGMLLARAYDESQL
jgi:hypothetical protein